MSSVRILWYDYIRHNNGSTHLYYCTKQQLHVALSLHINTLVGKEKCSFHFKTLLGGDEMGMVVPKYIDHTNFNL